MMRRMGFQSILSLVSMASLIAWNLGDATCLEAEILKNDSVADFNQVTIQAGFVADERAAAWLTSNCDGNLTAVQILWMSVTGGSGQVLGDSITISRSGTFPTPGAQLARLVGPALNDGFFNQFPLVPPVPIITGETVVVDFQFFEAPPASGPSLVTDVDGCQPSRNGIFAIPPSLWVDSCSLGVGGDFAIRAEVECSGVVFEDGFESGDTTAWSN